MRLFTGTQWDRPPKCVRCSQLPDACTCPAHLKGLKPAGEQTAQVSVEKRKKGKLVTVVRGLSPTESDFATLLTQLQTGCGAGGSVRADALEVQGDHADRIRGFLRELGYRVK
jgi:translation initiation factor 1